VSEREKVNILMVDDQPAKLLSYEAILGELGDNLIKATSATEALEQLLKNDIAVVLMDVSMPELDGFELAEMIRQHPRYSKTAIIFISAVHLTDLDRLKGYARGAVDYISVPVVPELLLAKVSVFAELHRKTRELQNLNEELRRLSASLITSQDDERRRIARELHDGLGQDLVAAKMTLNPILQKEIPAQMVQQAASDANVLIDHAIQKVRSMTHLLHPPMLEEIGLHSALQWLLEGFSKRSSIETAMDVRPIDFPRLAPGLETAIFRIVQEALTNVFRHAGATKAWVTLIWEEGRVIASVRDDGKGISDRIAEFQPASVGIGIGGMRQRVKEFGGELCLRNLFPGTLVEVVIPVKSSPQEGEPAIAAAGNDSGNGNGLAMTQSLDQAAANSATGKRLSTS
jgi:signal transduction histidine kinase